MNGAQALIRTLVASGVDVCFANPGTSEMHFVAALDEVPEMRGVLGLFEGVVTGAADGYGRMADKPAATLLHLGSGSRQRPGQPAQRPPGPHADRQHRRGPRHRPTSSTTRRSTPTSRRWPATCRGGSARRPRPTRWRPTRPRRWPPRAVRPGRSPRSSSRPTSRGSRPASRPPRWPATPAGRCAAAAVDEAAAALRSGAPAALFVGGSVLREQGLVAASRVAGGHRGQAAGRDLPGPARAGRRPAGGRAPRLPGRVRRRCSSTGWPTWCWSTPSRRCRSSPTRARPATWCPRAARCTCWPPAPTTRWRRSRRWPTRSMRRSGAPPWPRPSGPTRRPGR